MDKEEYRNNIVGIVEKIQNINILRYLHMLVNSFLWRNREKFTLFLYFVIDGIAFVKKYNDNY